MTQNNTNGPDNVYEGTLAPPTEPGVPTIGPDGDEINPRSPAARSAGPQSTLRRCRLSPMPKSMENRRYRTYVHTATLTS